MLEICKGKTNDGEDIIDFINYVFSQSERPHDFKTLLPKIYGGSLDFAKYHYLAKENGKIKATVFAAPLEYDILNKKLKAFGVGMVCVHPYSRQKGYMKMLMETMLKDIEKDCAFAFLGGQRQRYEYFGFEPAGTKLEFELTKTNMRHVFKNKNCNEVEIIPLNGEELCEKAYLLHASQYFHALRSKKDFPDILCSWNSRPFAVLYRNEFCGYVSFAQDGTVNEFILNNDELYLPVAMKIFQTSNLNVLYLDAFPYEKGKLEALLDVSETVKAANCESVRIFNWAETITACLLLKSKYEIVSDGTLILGIGGQSYLIKVFKKEVSVEKTCEKPDFYLSETQAAALIFSFSGEYIKPRYFKFLNEEKKDCLKSWFPLPFTINPCDAC